MLLRLQLLERLSRHLCTTFDLFALRCAEQLVFVCEILAKALCDCYHRCRDILQKSFRLPCSPSAKPRSVNTAFVYIH